MSGIITDMIDCPQCGLPAQQDEYYVIGEERVVCNWCGYNHLKTIEGTSIHKGYGSVHYVPKEENGSNQIVKFDTPVDIIDRHNLVMNIHDKSNVFVWNEEAKRLECLIGEMPKTLEEEYQEQRIEAEYYRQVQFGFHD